MKRHFSTLLSVLLVAVMILAMVPASVFAAGESLDIIASTGTVSGTTISWESTNFTWTTAKDASTTDIRVSDSDHFRAYQGSKTTITAKNSKTISQVAFTLTGSTYTSVLEASKPSTATAATSGSVVTFTFATPVSTFDISASAQWRVKKVEVAFAGESLTPAPAPTPVELPDNFVLKIDGKYVTDDVYTYTGGSNPKDELELSTDKADAATFTLVENADDTVSLKVGDKFLFSDATHVNFADTASDNTKFVIEATDGGFFIKCAVATFGGNAQYLEIYGSDEQYVTVFKMGSNTTIYTFTYEEVTLPGGGSQGGGSQGGGSQGGGSQGGGAQGGGSASTGDATVAIAISAAALAIVLAGVYFAKKRTLAD